MSDIDLHSVDIAIAKAIGWTVSRQLAFDQAVMSRPEVWTLHLPDGMGIWQADTEDGAQAAIPRYTENANACAQALAALIADPRHGGTLEVLIAYRAGMWHVRMFWTIAGQTQTVVKEDPKRTAAEALAIAAAFEGMKGEGDE